MGSYDYDLVIIGAGPGGYVAGIRASQLGMSCAVIEKDKPGGVCLNIGCIPSKALIHQAELFRSVDELEKLGVKTDVSAFEYRKVFEKSRKASEMLSKGVQFLLKKNGIDLISAAAELKGPNEVSLSDGRTVTGKNVIVATGSRPRSIPGFEFDEKLVLSSDGALMLEELPSKLVILGGGFIGVEFAHIMSSFGVEVTVVELLEKLLPIEDAEITAVLERAFKKRGIKVHTSTKALSVEKKKDGVSVSLEGSDGNKFSVEADKLLVVVGRAPNTEDIGLENVGITTEKGFIPVKDYYVTSVPSIYAIGDVVSTPQLAHVASKEGEIAVEHMAGKDPVARVDPNLIPSAVYCEPQVASFGYKERQAQEEGIPFEKATFPYRGAGKSVAIERSEGMVKVLYDPQTHEILGVHIVGADATELIHELLLAKSAELLPKDVAEMIHAHPTLSEAVMEAMRAVEGWAIHA
ncbi:MAG TPA: dihydrolipoyl dehydrogenase [Spirochaetota bacterium]|nr:dihydrolipoyl dehydrogenase [Spirochaetota bacterium]